MKTKSVSELIALGMNDVLNSEEMSNLFNTNYKTAKHKCECECKCQMDHDHSLDKEDCSMSYVEESDDDSKEVEAYNIAIEGLIKASAALDYVGFEKGAFASLGLANLVAEAKKKKQNDKKDKRNKKDKEYSTKSSKDSDKSMKDSSKSSKDSDKSMKDSTKYVKKYV
jgi:hypothetical protein